MDVDVFGIWNETVKEAKAKKVVSLLKKHYDIPLFEPPTKASTRCINSFYQAKYSMFTCLDSVNYVGYIDIDPALVGYWERNPEYDYHPS